MRFRNISLIAFIVLTLSARSFAQAPTPPLQPKTGPGGKQTTHAAVIKNRYGQGGQEYWIYEPDRPKPATASVVIFMHGWGGTNPLYYGAWIDHIVKRGNIVVFPRYQTNVLTRREDFIPNTLAAVKDGRSVGEIIPLWSNDLREFGARREKALLYPNAPIPAY